MDVAPDDRRPAGYQRWRDLLFLHWPMPRDVIRPLLPNGLEIDSLAGQAYVSLIPFVIAESRPARVPRALAARLLYGLPYFPAAMSMRRDGADVEYVSHRRGARDALVEVTWSIGDAMDAAVAGTRDHFLIERYNLYVARRGGLYRGRVRHPPYPLRRAAAKRLRQTVLSAAGLPTPTDPPLCHYSPGVDVEIFWPERIDHRNS